ncbi:hypothetical protein K440DRAFT_616539 [Wilcoxina mikolae CBS 423.85]|nr:hypothetical protein K440DRAFT_616539 [Wilcoxina mikolae CBS 423.85]
MEAKSQYQHFIPRFVLRDFAPDPAKGTGTQQKPKRQQKKKKKKKPKSTSAPAAGSSTPVDQDVRDAAEKLEAVTLEGTGNGKVGKGNSTGEGSSAKPQQTPSRSENSQGRDDYDDPKNPLIKFYDLKTGVLEQARVARVYGHQDMYRDLNASDVNHIENKLSVLENDAARVVKRIKDAQKSGAATVDLTRIQLNDLRKFLFVMRYRSDTLWKKFGCTTMDEYTEVDKTHVQAFMKLRGFTKPAEVWLHTMKVILDTPVDSRGEWQKSVQENGFLHDAMLYIYHMTESYLSFCQPTHQHDEFIITENGFGINEGPNTFTYGIDPHTKLPTIKPESFTEYHKFAPLSPKLLLVLRSNFLRKGNEVLLRAMRARPGVPNTPSLFENLQLDVAIPSYGMGVYARDFEMKDDHIFSFKIQKISTSYTDLFNAAMLEEARASITWSSDKSMQNTLKAYLANPKFPPNLATFLELKRKAKLRLLGILDGSAPKVSPLLQGNLVEMVGNYAAQKPELEVYFLLGGKPSEVMADMARATQLSRQRTQSADRSPKGPQHLATRNASNRRNMLDYSKQPSRIIYLHIKSWRVNANVNAKKKYNQFVSLESELHTLMDPGPEDLIGKLARFIDEKYRSQMMLEASMKAFFRNVNRTRAAQIWAGREESDSMMLKCEHDLFGQWGGISTSCFLENTPFYSDIGKKIMDPRRTKKIESDLLDLFAAELQLRSELKASGLIEERFLGTNSSTEEREWMQELLWEVLYWWPGESSGVEDESELEESPCAVS